MRGQPRHRFGSVQFCTDPCAYGNACAYAYGNADTYAYTCTYGNDYAYLYPCAHL